ncbi:hypothetical protein F887_02772 [Acinetobacter sp. NIPH 2100]|nr:hypothetical protein F887_02772 [Acinetobacter sp. NIPH 2100]
MGSWIYPYADQEYKYMLIDLLNYFYISDTSHIQAVQIKKCANMGKW